MSAVTTRILATGAYLPERVVPNEALTQFPAATLPLIAEKTGISARRYAADDESTSDLGAKARHCLERANLAPDEIDVIMLATSSPDRIQPATATRVQELIGARNAYAFDVGSVCSGAVFALHMADALIRSGGARRVLVVASELYSRSHLNPRDFSTCACLGDGAGALLVGPGEPGTGILGTRLHTDGAGADLRAPAGRNALLSPDRMGRKQGAFSDARQDVQEFVTTHGTAVVNELLAELGVDRRDLAFVVPHQAITVLQGWPTARHRLLEFVVTLDRYGNTAGASVLIAFDDLVTSGRVKGGELVALVVFGGGLSWAATLIRI
jgi:3-oxoacyl-[acyl-carrier-protein] synthase-3